MPTARATYLGNLRVKCHHLDSNTEIITDAPKDNHGNGESFSPTDLCCAALASCAMTIMGIRAQEKGWALACSADITKIMGADPRRIAKIEITFHIDGTYTLEEKLILQQAAESCPVCLSLGPQTEQVFTYDWQD